MIEINLIPDVKLELIKAQKVRSKVIAGAIMVSIVSVACVVLLVFYIFAVQTVRSGLADGSIDRENKKLVAVEDLSKTLTIQNQLTKISDLNSSKKLDSRIFDILLAIIPPKPNDVQISDLTIDSAETAIKINGQASNSYAAVEVFRKMITGATIKYRDSDGQEREAPLAADISTSNTSYGEDASGVKVLRFTLSFKYAEELFSPQSKNLTITIANKGNVTDSYLGVPNSIFAERAQDIPEDQ